MKSGQAMREIERRNYASKNTKSSAQNAGATTREMHETIKSDVEKFLENGGEIKKFKSDNTAWDGVDYKTKYNGREK